MAKCNALPGSTVKGPKWQRQNRCNFTFGSGLGRFVALRRLRCCRGFRCSCGFHCSCGFRCCRGLDSFLALRRLRCCWRYFAHEAAFEVASRVIPAVIFTPRPKSDACFSTVHVVSLLFVPMRVVHRIRLVIFRISCLHFPDKFWPFCRIFPLSSCPEVDAHHPFMASSPWPTCIQSPPAPHSDSHTS